MRRPLAPSSPAIQLPPQPTTPVEPRPRRKAVTRASRAGWVLMTLLSLLVVAYGAGYLRFDPSTYFDEQRDVYVHREFLLGLHISGAMLALFLGPLQFVARLRRRWIRLHRSTGIGYVAGATVGALGGLGLALTAYAGVVSSAGFAAMGLCTLFTTWSGLRMALQHRYADHRRWMIRSFSLIFGGVTLRLLLGTYSLLADNGLTSFPFASWYMAAAWLCWIPNLLVAVWFTRRRPEARRPNATGELAQLPT